MIKYIAAAVASLGVMATISAADAAAIKVGVLSCHVDSGWGLIVGSSKKANCTLTTSNGKKIHYKGNITKIGVDVGYTDNKTVTWVVMSLGNNQGSLAGTYMGAGVEATAIVGVGANALVGGLNNNFALQPVSVQGQTGLNAAVAVQSLTLR